MNDSMVNSSLAVDVLTITLNPAIDRTITIGDFTVGAVNRVETVTERPGGKGVNVALALANCDVRIAASGFLGADNASTFRAIFEEKGIRDAFVLIPGRTRVGIKIVDPRRAETTEINFPGLTVSPAHVLELHRRLNGIAARWVVIAGSLPPGVGPGIYAEMIQTLKEEGRKIVLDTSGEALVAGVAAGPTIIKPNIHELRDLVGAQVRTIEEVRDAARSRIRGGVEVVAVSMGADGALFVSEKDAIYAKPPTMSVGSTVGAGDAMVAGIILAHLRDADLTTCARIATDFAARALASQSNATAGTSEKPLIKRIAFATT